MNNKLLWLLIAALAALAGCAAPLPSAGLSDVIERPAERALLTGIRAYDDAQYAQAERALTTALHSGLTSPKDRASAHKLLAFIYCTSSRVPDCESAFRAARARMWVFVNRAGPGRRWSARASARDLPCGPRG